jgi:hypothetical protein
MKNKKVSNPTAIAYKVARSYGDPKLAHKSKKWLKNDGYYINCMACKTYIPIDKFCYGLYRWRGNSLDNYLGVVCNKLCGEMAILQII